MPVAKRILLVVNRTAGIGHDHAIVDKLRTMLAKLSGEQTTLQVEVVGDHLTARARANEFLAASDVPTLILVGGGGGTLRAVIEGLCEGSKVGRLPGRERVLIGPLRMGSGNVVARLLGIPHDPEAGLRGIIESLRAGRTVPCCVMRCEAGTRGGRTEVPYAATLVAKRYARTFSSYRARRQHRQNRWARASSPAARCGAKRSIVVTSSATCWPNGSVERGGSRRSPSPL